MHSTVWNAARAHALPWASHQPWNRWSRFFDSGEVRLALLSLLQEGPKHGYRLIKDLEVRSGGLYRASAGTIYPMLRQLEQEGLISSDETEGRRVCRLTNLGREKLKTYADPVKKIWMRAKSWEEWAPWMGPAAAMVAGPATHLIKAAMRAATRAGDDSRRISRILEILKHAGKELEQLGL
jgi:DNA-binding PadR family transcriptional regulator